MAAVSLGILVRILRICCSFVLPDLAYGSSFSSLFWLFLFVYNRCILYRSRPPNLRSNYTPYNGNKGNDDLFYNEIISK